MESVLNLMEKVDNVRKLITKEAEKVTNVFGQAALGSLFERCDDIAERIFSSDPEERESLIDVSLQEISSIESILTTTEKMTESLFSPYFKNSLFGGKKPYQSERIFMQQFIMGTMPKKERKRIDGVVLQIEDTLKAAIEADREHLEGGILLDYEHSSEFCDIDNEAGITLVIRIKSRPGKKKRK